MMACPQKVGGMSIAFKRAKEQKSKDEENKEPSKMQAPK
jgi:hypothetical protein